MKRSVSLGRRIVASPPVLGPPSRSCPAGSRKLPNGFCIRMAPVGSGPGRRPVPYAGPPVGGRGGNPGPVPSLPSRGASRTATGIKSDRNTKRNVPSRAPGRGSSGSSRSSGASRSGARVTYRSREEEKKKRVLGSRRTQSSGGSSSGGSRSRSRGPDPRQLGDRFAMFFEHLFPILAALGLAAAVRLFLGRRG